jgi:hypothetical protein
MKRSNSFKLTNGREKRLRKFLLRKRPELRPMDWILHHDNAPAQKALSVKEFLVQNLIT